MMDDLSKEEEDILHDLVYETYEIFGFERAPRALVAAAVFSLTAQHQPETIQDSICHLRALADMLEKDSADIPAPTEH